MRGKWTAIDIERWIDFTLSRVEIYFSPFFSCYADLLLKTHVIVIQIACSWQIRQICKKQDAALVIFTSLPCIFPMRPLYNVIYLLCLIKIAEISIRFTFESKTKWGVMIWIVAISMRICYCWVCYHFMGMVKPMHAEEKKESDLAVWFVIIQMTDFIGDLGPKCVAVGVMNKGTADNIYPYKNNSKSI